MKESALNRLAKIINREFDVNIFANTRKRDVVDARSIFCHIAYNSYGLSLHSIANYFKRNKKSYDHSTALHSIKMFEVVAKFNPRAQYVLHEILKETDKEAHAKYLVDEILTKADDHTKHRVINLLNVAHDTLIKKQLV